MMTSLLVMTMRVCCMLSFRSVELFLSFFPSSSTSSSSFVLVLKNLIGCGFDLLIFQDINAFLVIKLTHFPSSIIEIHRGSDIFSQVNQRKMNHVVTISSQIDSSQSIAYHLTDIYTHTHHQTSGGGD